MNNENMSELIKIQKKRNLMMMRAYQLSAQIGQWRCVTDARGGVKSDRRAL